MVWRESDHPRGKGGKFVDKAGSSIRAAQRALDSEIDTEAIPQKKVRAGLRGKGKLQTRVSLRSATVQYGRTHRLSPKYQVYYGALVRLERTEPTKLEAALRRMTTKTLLKVAESIPNARISRAATDIIEKRATEQGGVRLAVSKKRSARSFSASKTLGAAKAATNGGRAPRRAPRVRSAARAATRGSRVRR